LDATLMEINAIISAVKAAVDYTATRLPRGLNVRPEDVAPAKPGGNQLVPGQRSPFGLRPEDMVPQRFGAYGGADLGGLRLNENWGKMIGDPALQALGRSRIEDRRQDNQGVGGQPIVLTQMAESQRQMADDIGEVRDVLTWLRDQILSDYPIAV